MRLISILVAVFLLLPCMACAEDGDPGIPEGYVLAFSDEFSRDGPPDPSHWTLEEGPARYNEEKEYYSAENAWVEDGHLVIEARLEEREGMDYTSARMNTQEQFSFCYGRLEVRASLPVGRGAWSAIWLLPSDTRYGGYLKSGEIDLVEHVGYDPEKVHSTLHTERYNSLRNNAITGSVALNGEPGAFHDYVLMWDPEGIETYMDGERVLSYRPESDLLDDSDVWPFNVPFHLVVNLAIGGSWGGRHGIDDDAFPQRMLVDFIRVYIPGGD